ncbi:MAG: PqqD family protein [Bacteroidaceae bacterium]|nr:PqqD family protein [Bacteroidaceae bacterium]
MKIKKGFELQNVCGEYIIVPTGIENIDYSKIISLNETAAYLWEGCSKLDSFTIDTMVELLMREYEVEEDIAREDCEKIITRWIEMGLTEE